MRAQTRHEVGISAGGGVSALNYSLFNNGNTHLIRGFGGEAALSYAVYFNSQWAIGTGAGFALYNSTAILTGSTINGIVQPYPIENNNRTYQLQTTLDRYEEHQMLMTPYVPLFLHYEIASGKHHFYARIGGKLLLPMLIPMTYYLGNDMQITNKVLMDGVEIAPTPDEITNYGWGTKRIKNHSSSVDMKMGVMISAEAGTKWRLSNKRSLYTGLYADYGAFLDMHPHDKTMFEDRTEQDPHFKINSVIESQNNDGSKLAKMTSPLAVGIVLRLTFGFVPIKAVKQEPDIIDTIKITNIDTVYVPIHDTLIIKQTETLYRELTTTTGSPAAPSRNLLVRRDTVMVYKEYHHYSTDTVIKFIVDTLRVMRYKHTYIISNYLVSAVFVSGEKKATLDHVVSMLLSHPRASVIVEGHTCSYGSEKLNFLLGERRAQTVANYLMQNGISANRIKVVSKGDTEPIVLNDGEYSRRKNRRVKLIIMDSSGKDY
jgi:hypothetical protein